MSHYKPDPNKNVNLTIDGIAVTVPEGTRILEAARKVNVCIPTLCEHPDLCKRGVCRLCVVECDGRGKLLAACANDVWEGVNIVTNNLRILGIRKMIVELLLANHPQECLSCIRSTNCELQTLAADFGIRESPFRHDAADRRPPVIESETLVRDMNKCVKCGRCVEACQEVQTIRSINSSCRSIHYGISAPYHQSLAEGPCVFCGQCAAVCPVGAIYGHDQTAEAWIALNDKNCHTVIQIVPSLSTAVNDALDLPAGTVSPGVMITALKRLGFDQVFNSEIVMNAATAKENGELLNRIKNGGKLPMITVCSAGGIKFIADSYPDLSAHLSPCSQSQQMLSALARTADSSPITAITVSACIAQKFKYLRSAAHSPDGHDTGLTLTVSEIVRMFRQGGVNVAGLPEAPFDVFPGEAPPENKTNFENLRDIQEGIQKSEINLQGTKIKLLTVYGFAPARLIMDSIRKGECDASLVHIMSCPWTGGQQPCKNSN
ncbi:MAG: (2Fe-2S)-binding protein [Treponema sp.]|jgi:iron only hydrogenase large subunit-like protein|nr:(2Fe-2S)-binding protein [Treponema sp.]